jgi:hypothetical protein
MDGMAEFVKCAEISSDAISAMLGAGLGGGLGLISDAIRPVDRDEDRLKRRLSALIGGAALGGIAGVGMNQFKKSSPLFFPEKRSVPGRIFDAVDPAPSTAIAVGGLGYGLHPHFARGGAVREWLTPELRTFNGHNINWNARNMEELSHALAAYDNAVRSGRITERIGELLNKVPGLNALNPWKKGLSQNAGVRSSASNIANLIRYINTQVTNAARLGRPAQRPSLVDAVVQVTRSGGDAGRIANDVIANGGTNPESARRMAEMLSHTHARYNRMFRGRAGRNLALLLGLGALGYRLGK